MQKVITSHEPTEKISHHAEASVPGRPVKNYQDEFIIPEQAQKLHHDVFKEKYGREEYQSCFNCPVNCGRMYKVTDGVYVGTSARKLEANTLSGFGPKLGIHDPVAIVKLQALSDQYGRNNLMGHGVLSKVLRDRLKHNVVSQRWLACLWGSELWEPHPLTGDRGHRRECSEGVALGS